MGKKKKNLQLLTKYERQQALKREAAIDEEELSVLGQDSDIKAAKWIQEVQKEEDKLHDEAESRVAERLNAAKGQVFTYAEELFTYMKRLKHSFDIPQGFRWDCIKTTKGLTLWIRDKNGNWYARGTKICGDLKYDMNAVQRIILNGIDFMESFEPRPQEKGILLS